MFLNLTFARWSSGIIFRLSLPSIFSADCQNITNISKTLEGYFATGSSRNYTRIQVDFFPCVCVFLNLLTYSLTSTYAHSKQKPRKVWVKSAPRQNSVTIVSVYFKVALNWFNNYNESVSSFQGGVASAQCKIKGCPAARSREPIFAWKVTAGKRGWTQQTRKSSSAIVRHHLANLTDTRRALQPKKQDGATAR